MDIGRLAMAICDRIVVILSMFGDRLESRFDIRFRLAAAVRFCAVAKTFGCSCTNANGQKFSQSAVGF